MNKHFSYFLAFWFITFLAVAQKPDKTPIALDPSVKTGKLSNGMTYFIKQNKLPENRAELRLAVNAGSLMENDDQQGLAHFVEHMAFNGSKNFEKNDLVNYLESIGVDFGAHLNAYTSFDETVYKLLVPTDDEKIVDKSLLVLQDWAGGVSFEGGQIESERGVVIEEWRSRLGANQRISQKTYPVLFNNSQYAKRLPIGKKNILETFKHQTIKDFYNTWYRPELMAIVAVGDFDIAEMEKKIKQKFSVIPTAKKNVPARKIYEVPAHDETLVVVATDPEATYTTVNIYHKQPAQHVNTLADYRGEMLQELYDEMYNARLRDISQKANSPFSYAFGYAGSVVRSVDAYINFAIATTGPLAALEVMTTENERVRQHGFTEPELERAKAELLNRMKKQFQEQDKTKSDKIATQLVSYYLDDSPVPAIEKEYGWYKEWLPGISLQEVNKLAAKWLTTDKNTVITVTGPDKEIPSSITEEAVLQAYQKAKSQKVTPYEDAFAGKELLSKELPATQVAGVTNHKEVGVTEVRLVNGVKVLLKPTDFKNDEILMAATAEGGTSLLSDKDYLKASSAANIVDASGVGEFSVSDLEKLLAGKTVSLSPFIYQMSQGMRGQSSVEDLETMLKLVYLLFYRTPKRCRSF